MNRSAVLFKNPFSFFQNPRNNNLALLGRINGNQDGSLPHGISDHTSANALTIS